MFGQLVIVLGTELVEEENTVNCKGNDGVKGLLFWLPFSLGFVNHVEVMEHRYLARFVVAVAGSLMKIRELRVTMELWIVDCSFSLRQLLYFLAKHV